MKRGEKKAANGKQIFSLKKTVQILAKFFFFLKRTKRKFNESMKTQKDKNSFKKFEAVKTERKFDKKQMKNLHIRNVHGRWN